MRPHLAGIPSVRDRAARPNPFDDRVLFSPAFPVLLLLIGVVRSRQAFAAVAICALGALKATTSAPALKRWAIDAFGHWQG
jgi:hypothetical protein